MFEKRDTVNIAVDQPEARSVSRGIAKALRRRPVPSARYQPGDAYHSIQRPAFRLSGRSRPRSSSNRSSAMPTSNTPCANRPDRIANGRLDHRTPEKWFDVFAFREVPLGAYRYGNSGRNILDGPGFVALSLGVSKRFQIRDRDYLQFLCESFNVTNHTNFRMPRVNVNAPGSRPRRPWWRVRPHPSRTSSTSRCI